MIPSIQLGSNLGAGSRPIGLAYHMDQLLGSRPVSPHPLSKVTCELPILIKELIVGFYDLFQTAPALRPL